MYQNLWRRSFENRVISETAESNGEMVGVDVQTTHCLDDSTAVEDIVEETTAAELSDEDYSSDSSDKELGPRRHLSKKRRQVLSEDDDTSDKDDMHDCCTDVGTVPLEVEITGDENIDDTKERSGSVLTSARRPESLEESEAECLVKKFHKYMDYLMPSHLPGKPSSFQVYLYPIHTN